MKFWKLIGWLLIVFGALIAIFSERIVFPGLERLVGIETIVGSSNVQYQPDGSYYFTNPGAMIRWVASVASIGISIALTGVLVLIRSKKK
jgi:hypothetical protein